MQRAVPTNNAIAGIWRRNAADGEIEVLTITVTVRDLVTGMVLESKVKCPGGGSKPGEPIVVALQREVLEETYLSFLPESTKEIWRLEVEPNHTRYGFMVCSADCHGSIRRTTIFDDDSDELSEPRFVKLKDLLRRSDFAHREFGEALSIELGP